ncbi:exopolysaccharide biosynthesis GT4 family glycosyltransferase EpsE [Rhizobium sp. S96]|uniref:exopolysaccharide biosynthesis GT4 family glycosyltransferase EpsE n=1 Tax=Rhizobium sp. S96 TaxID=3055140 RepID=UPI0025AAFB1C|nr:exopolysaccharide biosynthesis GT4 family glycosyltransferase EpsE [Rhizobium sp. S96]MDM9619248.1 glycosyltransferase family 4 protein [Rhizobium sp. S96]
MGENLKIAYLVPQFPGQTHIFFWREINELRKRGVDLSVLSTRPPPPGLISHSWSAEAMANTKYLGQPAPIATLQALFSLPLRSLMTEIRSEGAAVVQDAVLCLSSARRLARHCAANGIDHVHVHSCGRAALIAALANRMTGLSYSLTLHGPIADYGAGQGFKWRRAAFASVITKTLLDQARQALGRDMPAEVVVQSMGVDTDSFARTSAYRPAALGERVMIFSCGRLNAAKGHQDLLQAVRQLVNEGMDVGLEIAGEDDVGGQGFRAVIEATIRDLQLTDRVKLLGAVNEAEVRRRLMEAHIFALASWQEPLGVAYMEAMSCEVPTIGTDAGGVRELITDGEDGILVPPRDPVALAGAIRTLVEQPELAKKISLAGRERVVAAFRSSLGAETLIAEIGRLRSRGRVR